MYYFLTVVHPDGFCVRWTFNEKRDAFLAWQDNIGDAIFMVMFHEGKEIMRVSS